MFKIAIQVGIAMLLLGCSRPAYLRLLPNPVAPPKVGATLTEDGRTDIGIDFPSKTQKSKDVSFVTSMSVRAMLSIISDKQQPLADDAEGFESLDLRIDYSGCTRS